MIELIESVIQFVELYIADDNHHGKNKKIPEKTSGIYKYSQTKTYYRTITFAVIVPWSVTMRTK